MSLLFFRSQWYSLCISCSIHFFTFTQCSQWKIELLSTQNKFQQQSKGSLKQTKNTGLFGNFSQMSDPHPPFRNLSFQMNFFGWFCEKFSWFFWRFENGEDPPPQCWKNSQIIPYIFLKASLNLTWSISQNVTNLPKQNKNFAIVDKFYMHNQNISITGKSWTFFPHFSMSVDGEVYVHV